MPPCLRWPLFKLRGLRSFRQVFVAYGVLPASMAGRLYAVIPLAELVIAVALLYPTTRVAASVCAALLLMSYAFAIALNLRRGRSDLLCGCAGPSRRSISRHMVWRNGALALLCVSAGLPWTARPWEPADGVTVVGGLAALAALYWAVEELCGVLQSTARSAGESK
jgi:hypothetical protein